MTSPTTRSTLPDVFDRHTAAIATLDLVGRDSLKQQINAFLTQSGSQPGVIILKGKGGIGKTRLLNEALSWAKQSVTEDGQPVLAASTNVDLYHVVHHTCNGLAEGIFNALSPSFHLLTNPFRNYEQEHRARARMWFSGEGNDITAQMLAELQAFEKDVTAAAKNQRIVIALDTAERLFYGHRPHSQEMITAEAWQWLLNSLPTWGNVTLFVAGREESQPLFDQFQAQFPGRVLEIPVEAFSGEESLAYLEAVEAAVMRSEPEVAARIRSLTADNRRLAHLVSGGRPILLALLVDYMVNKAVLPASLRLPFEQVQKLPQPELDAERNRLERDLIEQLLNAPDIGDTLRALGRLRKGVDADLLALVLPCSPEKARHLLRQARRYSFVKVRPSDERVFLHDEMYAMLDRHAFTDTAGDAPELERYEAGVLKYYDHQNDGVRQALNEVFAPIEEGKGYQLDYKLVSQLYAQRQALLSEVAYYRLRQNATRGYLRCCRYLREAVLTGDLLFYLQIQLELLSFLAETRAPGNTNADLGDLDPELILWELSLLPVVQAYISPDRQNVIAQVTTLRQAEPPAAAANQLICSSILDLYQAVVTINLGSDEDLQNSKERLTGVIRAVAAFLEQHPNLTESVLWRMRSILGSAYYARGYNQRLAGFMENAIQDYSQASRLLRQIDLRVELAIVLNDMGYAMAELGRWADARALTEDALALRRRLGPRGPVALSLNTLSLIDTREGNHDQAISYATSAFAVSRATGNKRINALALVALAEAKRRKTSKGVQGTADQVSLVQEARGHAREAYGIFEELHENSRMVDALIEIGCADRDWVKFRQIDDNLLDDIDKLAAEGAEALRRAADMASSAILYRRIDALVNLAWLGYYAKQPELIREAEAKVISSLDPAYLIDPHTGVPQLPIEQGQLSIWSQIGKLHVVKGVLHFDEYRKLDEPHCLPALDAATEEFIWALQYSVLFGADYQGIRRAKDDIYERLKVLPTRDLERITRKVKQVEADNNLGQSAMQRFLTARTIWYGE